MTKISVLRNTTEEVADRLSRLADPSILGLPRPVVHEAITLGSGYSGIALALLHASHALGRSDLVDPARALLRQAADSTALRPADRLGLYNGYAGFAWAVTEFAVCEPRYLPTLSRTAGNLGTLLGSTALREPGTGVPFEAYDVIAGVAGQLTALLRAYAVLPDPPLVLTEAATRLTAYLMRLTDVDDVGRHGWYVAPRFCSPDVRERSPHGLYNLGLAHGIPGVLAALCAAAHSGVGGREVRERVREIALWLCTHRLAETVGPDWPVWLDASAAQHVPVRSSDAPAARTAWCYGSPGIAMVLLSAAALTGTAEPADTAVAALRRVMAAGVRERDVFAPTLCHGHAGLAAVFQRAWRVTGLTEFQAARDASVNEVLALADPRRPYVLADRREVGRLVDDPGFLMGAAGVLSVLSGALSTAVCTWEDVLFLAPCLSVRNLL
ncbi:lanthionine synthetase C family protein [Nocardia vaccinii]|uniref:lanthionine synthetase C family protein n=1 Tax=Nocardia vaccinii TaxID=1822 RepID=UPI00082EB8F4|nr:lanthionine synthetase C family protein [Nocardia vaccinii]